MNKLIFLFLLLQCSWSNQQLIDTFSFRRLENQRNFDCINLRLRDIPITKLNKTNSGEYYLNAKNHDRLQLIFNRACDRRITCLMHNRKKNSYNTITTDGSDVNHIYLTQTTHTHIRCSYYNSSKSLLLFHLFVDRDDGRFFSSFNIVNTNSSGFFVECLGGYYSENVKLLINRKPSDLSYDPINGFFISNKTNAFQRFYQCEYGDELISSSSTLNKSPAGNTTFKMVKNTYTFRTELQCIISDYQQFKNVEVFLSCPWKSSCPELKLRIGSSSRAIYSTFLNKTEALPPEAFYCVFTLNGLVIRTAFIEKHIGVSIVLISLFLVGGLITCIVLLINSFGHWTYRETSISDTIIFKEEDLMMDEIEEIGAGNSSIIRRTRFTKTTKPVILKCSKNILQAKKELKILEFMDDIHIIKPIGALVLTEKKYCFNTRIQHLVLPYYPDQSLDRYISKFYPVNQVVDGAQFIYFASDKSSPQDKMSDFDRAAFAWQIALALEYLKNLGITHRDVAMRNVLVTNNRLCKLTDFELAKMGESQKTNACVHILNFLLLHKSKPIPWLMYPIECMDGAFYYSSEIYCFGNLLLEMYRFGQNAPVSKKAHLLILEQTPLQPLFCPDLIYELIVTCMKYNHRERPTIAKCESELRKYLESLSDVNYIELKKKFIDEGNRNIFDNTPEPSPYPIDPPSGLEGLFPTIRNL